MLDGSVGVADMIQLTRIGRKEERVRELRGR